MGCSRLYRTHLCKQLFPLHRILFVTGQFNGRSVFTSGRKRALELKMATKRPPTSGKKACKSGGGKMYYEHRKKQFNYAMNSKSRGQPRLVTT